MGIDADGSVRGRVTRVRLVSEFWDRTEQTADPWVRDPDSTAVHDEIDRAPRFFTEERLFDDGRRSRARSDLGVLIDLDLDDVPDLPVRPALVPGSVSVSGRDVWVLDRALPRIAKLTETGSATGHLFPARTGGSRMAHATPTGCWITGADGVYRVTPGSEPTEVCEGPVRAAAVIGEKLLVCSTDQRWRIHSPDEEPVEIDAPQEAPVVAAADGGRFVVVVRATRSGNGSRHRVARVALDGTVAIGPAISTSDGYDEPALLTDPPALAVRDTLIEITPKLDAGAATRLPRAFFQAGSLSGELLWTIGHPPDGTSRSGWWPLAGATDYDHSRGQFWLLTVLDRSTLEPVHVAPVLTPQPSIAQDAADRLWVATGTAVQTVDIESPPMCWPTGVDLTATTCTPQRG